ncbi:MAG: NUDIX hydrolase [Verrucomicrobiae bacterium]
MASSDHQPWEVLGSREVYAAPPFLRLHVERVRLPDGRVVEDFHRIEKPDYALVVPILPDGRILLLRQYKHGVRAVGLYPPGGHIAERESPLEAVQRELLEETGYTAAHWHLMGAFTTDANQGGCRAHFFLARDAQAVADARSDDLEHMELVLLTPDELQAAIRSGEVNALGAIAALTLALTLS